MQSLIRLPEVKARTGLSRSCIYEAMSDGRFPRPVKITARASAWVESEVQKWIEERINQRGGADS